MKKFEEPKLNVEDLRMEDIITTSTCEDTGDSDCSYQTSCFTD